MVVLEILLQEQITLRSVIDNHITSLNYFEVDVIRNNPSNLENQMIQYYNYRFRRSKPPHTHYYYRNLPH